VKQIGSKRKLVEQDVSIEEKINDNNDEESNSDDNEDEVIDASDNDDDSDDDDEIFVEHRQKRRRTKALATSDGSWDCPHCNKKFGSSLGLQYHVDMFVCQPTLRPGGTIIRKGRRKIVAAEDDEGTLPAKAYKKIRGKINDRTCPHCRRIFTSVAGMQYHRGTSILV
jgi:rubrerythrin